ncbi:hypothetical protein BG842_05195 [Haladaptatus sp. W1]|uniref:PAS domain-containing protein n=1 Tax=Haladaptatus sp. W1 TaxID=1897478 RepID=UPI000849BA4D|nr:PAS domain-containing protein [Haladaptatus sp. W1]ODR81005.1 hypothetical protein BG842_05195 [Haladaptatus sp. W1]
MSLDSLTPSQRETLALFDKGGTPRTTNEIADILDIGRRSTYGRLERLVKHGRLETKKVGASGRVWWRPPEINDLEVPDWSDAAESLIHVLDDAEVGVFVLDDDFRVTWINDTMERYFGLDRERAIGSDKRSLIEDRIISIVDDSDTFTKTVLSTYDNNAYTEQFECHVTAGDGRNERWLEHRSKPIESGAYAGGRIELYYDITDRKRAEQQLRESELEEIYERMDAGFVALDERFQFTYVNERASELLERLPSKLLGEHFWDAFELEPSAKAAVRKAMETKEPGFYEEFYEPLETWFEIQIYPTETGLSFYLRDVTERKENKKRLEQYERVVETIDDGIYVLDDTKRFTLVNDGFVSMVDTDRSELIGANAKTVFGADIGDFAIEDHAGQASGDQTVTELEEELYGTSDGPIIAENQVSPFELDSGDTGHIGIVRDVTDHVERERQLEKSEQRYRTLVDNFPNGVVILFDEELRYLTAGGEVFDGLSFSASELEGSTPSKSLPPDLLEGLEPNYRAALEGETSEFEIEFGDQIRDVRVLPVYDEQGTIFAGMAMSQDITEHVEREQELERQREHLTALNHINDVIHDINEAIINQSSREEIEAIVCERLANTESYQVAWIGDVDSFSETMRVQAKAGAEQYVDDISISINPDDERSKGPTARAVFEREVQVTEDVATDSNYVPWSDTAHKAGIESTMAIPIIHEETLYGVLNVYSERPDAFATQESEVIGQLGEIVGHAIASVERKHALMSDDLVEVEYNISNIFTTIGAEMTTDERITFTDVVPSRDDRYLVYGTITDSDTKALDAMVAQLSHWDSIRIIDDKETATRFELRLTKPPVLSAVASRGGYIDIIEIKSGDYFMRVHLPPSVDVRSITNVVQQRYPTAELFSQRQISRPDDSAIGLQRILNDELTDRQRSALEAAFNSGFFEWPRSTTGEDVAESLEISSPTFHQHLRKAEQKVFDTLLQSR